MSWINSKNQENEEAYPFSRWISWFFLAISVLLMIYTYYRSEIFYQGNLSAMYFKYYLISLVGILFWGVVLRLREVVRANIVTVVTALVVGLYMVEGGLIFLGLGQPGNRAAAAAELGVEFDKRTKLEVIEDLIKQGVDAVPAVRPRGMLTMDNELLPLGGISNKITVASNENGYFMVYQSDRYGFNNPDVEWDAAQVEWLLTGDSFTEGVAVRPGEDIAGQIRVITDQSSISLGRSGNGPLIELAELIEYAEVIKPRRVFWVYYEGNDLTTDLHIEQNNPLPMQYMDDKFSQNLINRQQEIDNRLEEYIVLAQAQAQAQAQLHKTRWIRLQAIRKVIVFDADADADADADVDPLFKKILTKAKSRVDAWGGEFYFVYLPEHSRYNNTGILHDRFRKKSEVINLVKGLEIPVIDIHQEIFADHPDPHALFPFRLSGHYNAEGYAEVAKAIVTNVKEIESR